jgi:predicted CoA-substrate-specific enzyme activase
MKALGFCFGSSSVSLVELEKIDGTTKICRAESISHGGDVKAIFEKLFPARSFPENAKVAGTGRKFRNFLTIPTISEPEAVELAYAHLAEKYGKIDAIISAGGETFIVYELDAKGKICDIHTGNKCASGTGEFFLQQIRRMGLNVEDALKEAEKENPYPVAARCSVFCKSDCTHALNKGQAKGRVIAGLCKMMSGKIVELLKKCKKKRILMTGGTALNKLICHYIQEEFPELISSEEAAWFEALGTALYALQNNNDCISVSTENFFKTGQSSFKFLQPLSKYLNDVDFKKFEIRQVEANDECIIGLDVGSTTTKAVLLRTRDNAVVSKIYIRTMGNPIAASKECYAAIAAHIKDIPIKITGIGVTGSGRQIAGLHALTDAIINEIVAHAAAAVYFDPEVDTIFEIGGQDAKYTFITNRVPSDYAMNEACSAGTGSFLEESAIESLGVDFIEIAKIAMEADNPPEFNDQCAAFISNDIKIAIQEGLSHTNIIAGLVYSICQNYCTRVKGNRPVGRKVFMQGGVCYNMAVPIAMASLTGSRIIVPPEPGLMGAFGVALETKKKLELKIFQPKEYDLKELSQREAVYGKPFTCAGGDEKCDRKCAINIIKIKNEKHPFGGACNKFYNLRHKLNFDSVGLDLVALREELIFNKYAKSTKNNTHSATKVGIPKTFMVNSLYPMYHCFFSSLGCDVVLGDEISDEGKARRGAAFCYPAELAHGILGGLLKKSIDYLFIPQIMQLFVDDSGNDATLCPFVQGEPYYMKTSFPEIEKLKIISPVLNFKEGFHSMEKEFIGIGRQMGCDPVLSRNAFRKAVKNMHDCKAEMGRIGREVLLELDNNPGTIGIILMGRSYNAFTRDANMGIPRKIASRGKLVIPCDFLPLADCHSSPRMYWASGQIILKASELVRRHPSLFAAYITNFSCGPDSFLIGYFRDIMGEKPSLTLELDSHTADAGIETRIEAFLDVVQSYRELSAGKTKNTDPTFKAAETKFENKRFYIVDSQGKKHSLKDKKVHLVIPSMGDTASRLLAATFRYCGVRADCLPPPGEKDLRLGKTQGTCKECLPLMLTLGSGINYLMNRQDKDEILVYFMPETDGPCRFGQYKVMMEGLVKKHKLPDITLLSLSSENGYAGFSTKFHIRAWRSLIIADTLDDIYSAILVLAKDQEKALCLYRECVDKLVHATEHLSNADINKELVKIAEKLSKISRKDDIQNAKTVALIGEIYVRRDTFSRSFLVEKLSEKGIVVKVAPITEWIYYCDYIYKKGFYKDKPNFLQRIKSAVEGFFKNKEEYEIKKVLSGSGFYKMNMINVEKVVNSVQHLVSPRLAGETILTVGATMTEIIEEVSGVIAIGPFGCMPNRLAEAIIGTALPKEKEKMAERHELFRKVLSEHPSLPFLAIESDGNVFPQITEAKLDAFCLQVDRINRSIKLHKRK